MKIKLTALFLTLLLFLTACADAGQDASSHTQEGSDLQTSADGQSAEKTGENTEDIYVRPTAPQGKPSDSETGVGAPLEQLGIDRGYFRGDGKDLDLECLMGTKGAYKLEGNTLTFTAIGEETIYAISGKFRGNIVIDVGDAHKFELEFRGFSIIADAQSPITVLSGEEVALKAKKEYDNYIYDDRAALDPANESLRVGAISSDVDLEIGGKGKLTVVSKNNNGIHSKDDLQVKNLSLLVVCEDNALKGNDSVSITGGVTTLIATDGDAIKTVSTDYSSKGKQRGSVSIAGGAHTLYAASDGIDASYNVTLDKGLDTATSLTVYTDQYSNYSKNTVKATDADPRSAKGIRAGNVIVINDGTVTVRSLDASIHASNDSLLENGASPIGNITVNGGSLTLYSDRSGIHADGTLKVVAGTVNVRESKKGFEASYVDIYGGSVSINAKEDGISATASEGEAVRIRGGQTYIRAKGDGIDSNSQSEAFGITISGGRTVILAVSEDSYALNTEKGYSYTGGALLAVMPRSEETETLAVLYPPNFESVGKAVQAVLSSGEYLTATIGEAQVTLRIPVSIDALVTVLGDATAEIECKETVSVSLDENGVCWQDRH